MVLAEHPLGKILGLWTTNGSHAGPPHQQPSSSWSQQETRSLGLVPRLPAHLMAEFGYLGAGSASLSLLLGGQAPGPRYEGDWCWAGALSIERTAGSFGTPFTLLVVQPDWRISVFRSRIHTSGACNCNAVEQPLCVSRTSITLTVLPFTTLT